MSPTHPLTRGGADVCAPRRALFVGMVLCLWGCSGPGVGAPTSTPAAMPVITEIAIERDCFGCASGAVLVLRRDGSAQRTQVGKARHRTADVVALGRVAAADFEALARFVETQNFFAMADEYQEADVQDGPWTVLRVVRGAQEKRVFRRDEAGPDALKRIGQRIDAVALRIAFAAARP